ncbi:hypothetical protein EON65_48725 [archaeon]|nr:MAG: hypothetical protein EON65_48725 [archaeon]
MIATFVCALVILHCIANGHAYALRYQTASIKKSAYHQKNAIKLSQPPTMKAAVVFPSIGQLASKATKDFISWSKVASRISTTSKTLLITFIAFLTGIGLHFNERFKSAADVMESGWKKRGYGGSFARTVEVWTFAISYLFKYVSLDRMIV